MENIFSPSSYFNLDDFLWKELFARTQYVWDVLPKLSLFIEQLFHQKIITPNYGKNIYIGKDTIIQRNAEIIGPALIGEKCVIGHAAFLRENCILGSNVHVGHAVEIKNTVVLNNSSISHLNYVGDSIVGNDVNISGGVIVANFRLDKKEISIKHAGKKIDTGLVKCGSIIGDGSNIGVNSVLNPGTILGKKSVVFPLTCVTGVHPDESVIK